MKKHFRQINPRMLLLKKDKGWPSQTIRHFIEAMRRHDPALVEHGRRTAVYSLVIGRALELPDHGLSDLCHAALLHDLGKLTLPNEVRHQNGLSIIGDYLMTECSPQAGAELLRPWPDLQPIAKLIALHHERWDGNGLPFGMRGTLIPLGARILSLTDTVDQLLSQKEDPIPQQMDMLVRILQTLSGTRFDPKLVEVFVEVFVPSVASLDPHDTADSPSHPEQNTSSSVLTLPGLGMLCGTHKPSHPTNRSFVDPHLKNILELTNSVLYDSILT